jgi:hypothetical protein
MGGMIDATSQNLHLSLLTKFNCPQSIRVHPPKKQTDGMSGFLTAILKPNFVIASDSVAISSVYMARMHWR